jgi:hypothetical protein
MSSNAGAHDPRHQRPQKPAGEGGGNARLDLAEENLPPGQQRRRRREGSERPLQLIGAENLERRQAGEQKERQGDEPPAAGQSIDKAGDSRPCPQEGQRFQINHTAPDRAPAGPTARPRFPNQFNSYKGCCNRERGPPFVGCGGFPSRTPVETRLSYLCAILPQRGMRVERWI